MAASDHGMTQSAASQSVQHLEDFLSVQLIDRTKRPFVLTAEGQKFYDGLSGVLRQFDSLVDEVRLGGISSGETVAGQVVAASIYSMGLSYIPILQEKFQKHYPSATFAYQLAHPHVAANQVIEGLRLFRCRHARHDSAAIIPTPKKSDRYYFSNENCSLDAPQSGRN